MVFLLLSIVIAVTLAVILYYKSNPGLTIRQRIGLMILRTLTLTLFLSFLLNPIWYYIQRYTQKPVIIMLKDVSASMQLIHKNKSKANQLDTPYSKLKDAYKQSGYTIIEHEFADGLEGKSSSTTLIPALEKLKTKYAKLPINHVVLFSDGWFRDVDLRTIKNFEFPIDTVSDTTTYQNIDLQISELKHNRQGYRNELSLFQVVCKSNGFRGLATVNFQVNNKVAKGFYPDCGF
jgi:hypothetical protein